MVRRIRIPPSNSAQDAEKRGGHAPAPHTGRRRALRLQACRRIGPAAFPHAVNEIVFERQPATIRNVGIGSHIPYFVETVRSANRPGGAPKGLTAALSEKVEGEPVPRREQDGESLRASSQCHGASKTAKASALRIMLQIKKVRYLFMSDNLRRRPNSSRMGSTR